MTRTGSIAILLVGLTGVAAAVSIPGGGSKRNDCVVTMQAPGLGFPADKVFKGATCADGGPCDADGMVNGSCDFLVSLCLNAPSDEPKCSTAEVSSLAVTGKMKGGTLDLSDLQAAVDGLALPTSDTVCTAIASVLVAVRGPDNKGELASGQAKIKSKAKTSHGTDKDKFQLVCRPSSGTPTTSSTIPQTTTTTSLPGTTTTTSTIPVTAAPGAGLQVAFVGLPQVDANGVATVNFSLTDDAGVPITPQTSSVNPPNDAKARVRFTIARLEVNDTTITRWQNYNLSGSGTPTVDPGGATAFAPAGPVGVWTYTFTNPLPAGFPAALTHRIGGQVQRTYEGEGLVANPILDWVPAGGPVTTERDVVSTGQCNQCHNPLAVHGGGRREVRLCQTCHTDQWVDPDTGAPIEFKNMIHRIHTGKDLPSVNDGPVGSMFGFGRSVFSEKVSACVGGALAGLPCEADADCPSGTCTGATTEGVAFPKDTRNCTTCHANAAQADNYLTSPSARACTGCHDDVNPSESPTDAGPPGTNHLAGAQPDAFCRLCHTPEGDEFDISVPGAHVVPARSTELAGLVASIVSVQGTPGNPITMTFRVTDNAGTPLASLSGLATVALATSGPTTDFTGAVRATLVGNGATGTVTGPDVEGNYGYTSSVTLPADAEGTWRVGMEMRRSVTLSSGETLNEAAQNPVALFSVDGSPVKNRRTVVDQNNCAHCHGTFSVDFSIHGNLRNRVEYCVICHNPNATDYDRRRRAIDVGADPMDETITFKHLIHKIHTGENLEQTSYVVYGFGSAPANFTAHDFSEIRFPGDRRDCGTCHTGGSQLLPLPDGLLPTLQSIVDTSGGTAVELPVGHTPPIQDACLACHDADDAAAHAETMTTVAGAEACNVCHEEGALVSVSDAHAR